MASKKKPAGAATTDDKTVEALARIHIWQVQAIRDVLFVAAVIGLVWAGYALRAVTVPLMVALLLAYLFEPIIEKLCKHPKITRVRAVSTVLLVVVAGFVIVLAVVIPLTVMQSYKFAQEWQNGRVGQRIASVTALAPDAVRENINDVMKLVPGYAHPLPPPPGPDATGTSTETQPPGNGAGDAASSPPSIVSEDAARLDELQAQIAAMNDRLEAGAAGSGSADKSDMAWTRLARGGLDAAFGVIGMVVQISLLAFLIPFYFFFFSLWYDDVVQFGAKLIPAKNSGRTFELIGKMDRVVSGFVRGRIIISLVMGVLLAAGWMACRVPYAVPVGLLVGILCIVPYLGGVGIPVAVGLLITYHIEHESIWLGWWGVLLWPTLVFGIVQIIEGYVLTPMIAGKATNLDPVTIVVAVLAGGSVLGIYGMLLSIPVAACAKILFTDVLMPRILAWTRGEAADPLPIDRA